MKTTSRISAVTKIAQRTFLLTFFCLGVFACGGGADSESDAITPSQNVVEQEGEEAQPEQPVEPEAQCEDSDSCDEVPHISEEDEQGELAECDEDEGCEGVSECAEDDEECAENDECNADEEACQTVGSGYVNPNPLANDTVMTVEQVLANKASRFLSQATLGADYPTITQVASLGEDVWLENQFQQPIGYLRPYTEFLVNRGVEIDDGAENEDAIFEALGDPEKFHMYAWWTQVMTSPDLVRQRMAMALSEIFVVSSNVEAIGANPFAMSGYYDTLLEHSFGNFRDLLRAVSLNPAMGLYLSHLNNTKADPIKGTYPDENYAREVMQLFSIGLFELNSDGTRKKDANGADIPTYGQDQIREFAKIFTGLSYDSESGFGLTPDGEVEPLEVDYLKSMRMHDEHHSTGEKRLLNGLIVPGGQGGMQDINSAMDNLFHHPNVGPFIGKQLIQRLVKSNPSPAYVARVTAAFNGNDTTPRGDMKALIRAILLDPEAQTLPQNAHPHDGRLREPFIRLVRLARAFKATTSDRTYSATGLGVAPRLRQYVLYAPSVFNFFQPGYAPNGEIKDAGLVAPEFQITNSSTIIEIKNLVQEWLATGRLEEPDGALPTETLALETELSLAEQPDALLEHLDTLLTYGTLSTNTRSAVKTAIENEPNLRLRVQKAIYLIAISPDYAVAM